MKSDPMEKLLDWPKIMVNTSAVFTQPSQLSPARLGSAQISRAKFLGMEFINQMGLSPLQPELATSHRAPGPAWRGLYKEIV